MMTTILLAMLLWGLEEAPSLDLHHIPAAHHISVNQRKVPIGRWLRTLEAQLNAGSGDGHLSLGEFKLAKGLRISPTLRHFPDFASLASFLSRSHDVHRCHQRKKASCPPWPTLPAILPPTMRSKTKGKRQRVHYRDSRNMRLCRAMFVSSLRQSPTQRALHQSLKQAKGRFLQARKLFHLLKLDEGPQTLASVEATITRRWQDKALRKEIKQLLGFLPKRKDLALLLFLSKHPHKQPAPRTLRRLTLLWQTHHRQLQALLPLFQSSWLFRRGDPRSRRTKAKEWRTLLRFAPPQCAARILNKRRGFFCNTTLHGAFRVLSVPFLYNQTVRMFARPFEAHTFHESLRACLTRVIGPWIRYGEGAQCLTPTQQKKLFALLVRATMHRYEPYGQARINAIRSLAQWDLLRGLPCFLVALHPRHEPKRWIRTESIRLLTRLAIRYPNTRPSITRYLLRSAKRSFERDLFVQLSATMGLLKLGSPAVAPRLLAHLHTQPGLCDLVYTRRAKRKIYQYRRKIPYRYWRTLTEYLHFRKRPKAQRKKLYQLASCPSATLPYLNEVMLRLHPKVEPDPALRRTLWQALRWRFVPFHYGYWERKNRRLPHQTLLWRRNVLATLQLLTLHPGKEPDPTVRSAALAVGAHLKSPHALQMLHLWSQHSPQEFSPDVLRGFFSTWRIQNRIGQRRLQHRSRRGHIHHHIVRGPIRTLRYTDLARRSFEGFSPTQKRHVVDLLVRLSSPSATAPTRKLARTILSLLRRHPDPHIQKAAHPPTTAPPQKRPPTTTPARP